MKNIFLGLIAAIFLSGCAFKVHHIKEPTIVEKRIYVPKYVYKTKYKTRVKYVPKYIYKTKTKYIYKYRPYPKKKKKIIYKYY